MILTPDSLTFSEKNFSMILYGSPGIGKSTLALSAPSPVLIDFDNGIARVKAYHRKLTICCSTYEEVLKDVQAPVIKDCQTIIIDTGGSFVTYLQDWAMRTNPAVNRTKSGTISLKGFGTVKQEFQRFTNYVRDTLHKNIIYVFHSQEQSDKDGNPQQRLLCEGAVKNIVWQPCDLGGYMQMIGDQRTIAFTPSQEYFAKGCFGIEGVRAIPKLGLSDPNDFLTRLFDEARANIAKENEFFLPQIAQYNEIMVDVRALIDTIVDADTATVAANKMAQMEHVLTSKAESRAMLSEKVESLGLYWDKEEKAYKGKA